MTQMYPESVSLQKSWAEVRQEQYKVARISGGQLTAWGEGKNGELGLGSWITNSPKPEVIPRLRNHVITQVSAGRHHVLAINDKNQLYVFLTWRDCCSVEIYQELYFSNISVTLTSSSHLHYTASTLSLFHCSTGTPGAQAVQVSSATAISRIDSPLILSNSLRNTMWSMHRLGIATLQVSSCINLRFMDV